MITYFALSSLEQDLGVSAKTLYALTNDIEKHYNKVRLPKKGGGYRYLSVPDDLLKLVQKKINRVILSIEPISRYATAYVPGSNVLKNAKKHVGKEKVLRLDIKRFFDSIIYATVKEKVFSAERFSEANRILLTMLCYHVDKLPQGAPTSPAITNIIMRDFDEKVGAWCKGKNITYTRYCDDMTFSGSFDEGDVISFVSNELKQMGFFLNKKKTSVATQGKRQFVTGIVVNDFVNTSVEYRKKLRQEVYYLKKFGVGQHMVRSKVIGKTEISYLLGLRTKLDYALHTNPNDPKIKKDRDFVAALIAEY